MMRSHLVFQRAQPALCCFLTGKCTQRVLTLLKKPERTKKKTTTKRNNTQLYIIQTHSVKDIALGTLYCVFFFVVLGALCCLNAILPYGRRTAHTHTRDTKQNYEAKIKTKTTTSHTHLVWASCVCTLFFLCFCFENAINKTK